MHRPTLIIGAGPSGLAAALTLMESGHEVCCLESASTPGGMLRSVSRDGFLAEEGPHSMRLAAGPVDDFLRTVVPEARRLTADSRSAKKFITSGGRVVAAPTSPFSAALSPLLSPGEKLRFAAEPFIPRRKEITEESVADFVSRRIGRGAYAKLVDAVVGGVYAGDGATLSARHAFPALWDFEHTHGGLVRGAFATRQSRRQRGPLQVTGFAGGMGELAAACAAKLGTSLSCGARLTSLRRIGGEWQASWIDASGTALTNTFGHVVITAPAHRWSDLPLPGDIAEIGKRIPHPPVAVVTLGYARDAVKHPLDGFGVLSPTREKREALGILFTSSIFPGRAPDGAVTLALFIGGTRQPHLAGLPQEELKELARKECESLLGARGRPEFTHAATWKQAIPQYTLGHGERMTALAAYEAANPGLVFAGNFRGGPALGAALESGILAAQKIIAHDTSERGAARCIRDSR